MKQSIEWLSESIKTSVQENTVLIFRCPRSKAKKISEAINLMNGVWKRFNIAAIACPDDIEVIVVPQGSGVKLNEK